MRKREFKKESDSPRANSMFIAPRVQGKLKIGDSNDKYEQEADHVANQVVSQSKSDTVQKKGTEEEIQQKPIANQITPFVQKMTSGEEEPVQKALEEEPVQMKEEEESVQKLEEDEPVQRQKDEEPVQMKLEEESVQKVEDEQPVQMKDEEKPVQMQMEDEPVQMKKEEESVQKVEEEVQKKEIAGNSTHASPSVENRINQSKGSGQKLGGNTKNEMESGFGADFSDVTIHTDENAAQMSEDLGAKAFTHGNDVYFNKGEYNPEVSEGKHLLAHELTHTIQQKGMVQREVQRVFEPEDAVEEMIGKFFIIDTNFERNGIKFPLNSVIKITSWTNNKTSVSGMVKAVDGKMYPVDISKSSLRPIGDTKSGLDQYSAGANQQAKDTKAGEKRIADWKLKEQEYKKAKNLEEFETELKRLEELQKKRNVEMNKTLIQETMYNALDSLIVKWTKHYNGVFPYKEKLDPNVVKSVLYEETKIGTSGINLEKAPYSYDDGQKHPVRSRFNVGQAIDSYAPQQYLMIKEMDSTIYKKYGLSALEKEAKWKGMTNSEYSTWNGGIFLSAMKEFSTKLEAGKNLMGNNKKELYLDYEFWIRTSIRWIFEKRKISSSWQKAVELYNSDGSTKYAQRVMNRVTKKTN